MALVGDSIHPIDLSAIFAGAGNIMQLRQAREAEDRANAFRQALQAGDMVGAQAADPFAFQKMQQQQLEATKAQVAMQKDMQGMADARAKRTQEESQAMARTLAQNPRMAGYFRRRFDILQGQQMIDPINVPGSDTANTLLEPGQTGPEALPTRDEVTTAQRMSGADPYDGLAPEVKEYVQVTGDQPGSPGFGERFDARAVRLRRAGATTINNNLKELPANQINELSDLDTAMQSVDSLLQSFNRDIASGELTDQLVSRGEKYIPNSTTAQYQNDANVTAQTVGLILENGKLGEADLPRYKAMLPQPGDSPETAARKVAVIKDLLRKKQGNRRSALGSGGFKTPTLGGDGGATSGPTQPNQAAMITKRAQELKAAGVPMERAREIMIQEGYQIGGP